MSLIKLFKIVAKLKMTMCFQIFVGVLITKSQSIRPLTLFLLRVQELYRTHNVLFVFFFNCCKLRSFNSDWVQMKIVFFFTFSFVVSECFLLFLAHFQNKYTQYAIENPWRTEYTQAHICGIFATANTITQFVNDTEKKIKLPVLLVYFIALQGKLKNFYELIKRKDIHNFVFIAVDFFFYEIHVRFIVRSSQAHG